MSAIAVIPARAGSQRIPGKNIKLFENKPIIAYPIAAALASTAFDHVMVSTDGPEIAEVARAFGAEVPFMRQATHATSEASTASVLLEVLDAYAERGMRFDLACCVYPCNPFLSPHTIVRAKHELERADFDAVFTAVRYGHPVQRAFVLEQQRIKPLFPECSNSRTQDLPSVFHDAAQLYWFRVDRFLEHKTLWTANAGAIELPESEVQDIDTPADWELAELKYRAWRTKLDLQT